MAVRPSFINTTPASARTCTTASRGPWREQPPGEWEVSPPAWSSVESSQYRIYNLVKVDFFRSVDAKLCSVKTLNIYYTQVCMEGVGLLFSNSKVTKYKVTIQ